MIFFTALGWSVLGLRFKKIFSLSGMGGPYDLGAAKVGREVQLWTLFRGWKICFKLKKFSKSCFQKAFFDETWNDHPNYPLQPLDRNELQIIKLS